MKGLPWITLALAFGLGWLLAPGTGNDAGVVQARKDPWQLPDLPQRQDQVGRAMALAGAPIFEPEAPVAAAAAADAAAKAEDKRWRLAGVFGRGRDRKVLITFVTATRAPLRLAVGDKLPNGDRIAQINDGEVLVRVANKLVPLGADYRE